MPCRFLKNKGKSSKKGAKRRDFPNQKEKKHASSCTNQGVCVLLHRFYRKGFFSILIDPGCGAVG